MQSHYLGLYTAGYTQEKTKNKNCNLLSNPTMSSQITSHSLKQRKEKLLKNYKGKNVRRRPSKIRRQGWTSFKSTIEKLKVPLEMEGEGSRMHPTVSYQNRTQSNT